MRLRLREPDSGRFRASFRALVPAIVTVVLAWTVFAFVFRSVGNAVDFGIFALYGEILLRWLPVLLIGVWFVLKLDRRPFREYGFEIDRRWGRDFTAGVFITLLSFGLAWIVGYVRGTITLESQLQSSVEAPISAAIVGCSVLGHFFVQNVYEEFMYRGVMLQNFVEGARARGLSVGWAVVVATVTSLLFFALYHVPRGFVLVVDSLFVGITFAVPYLLTGSLGLSIGVHFGRIASSFLVVGDGYGGEDGLLEGVGVLTLQTDGFAVFAIVWIVVAVVLVTVWVRMTRGEVRLARNVSGRS